MFWDLVLFGLLAFVALKLLRRLLHYDQRSMRRSSNEYLADYHRNKKPRQF